MNSCKNCGHESHCGGSHHRTEKDYDGKQYTIKVCDHCRCDSCQKKDKDYG